MHRRVLTTGALALALTMLVTVAALAQQVLVTLTNPPGTRQVFIEDLVGNPLTSLELGTSRSRAFRVRVVDTDMNRTGFTVQASMSHLYLDNGGGNYDHATRIPSSDVSIDYPTSALNVLDVGALLSPIFDGTLSISAVCTLLGILPLACPGSDLLLSDMAGTLQNVDLPVNLANLTILPLVPQTGDTGSFTFPSYLGVGSGDPSPGADPATKIRVLSGAETTDIAGMLAGVESVLSGLVSGLPADQVVPQDVLILAIKDAVLDALGITLTDALALELVDDVATTLQSLTIGDLLRQTGTYLSYPILKVNVPGTAAGGNYGGTLVVTAVQS